MANNYDSGYESNRIRLSDKEIRKENFKGLGEVVFILGFTLAGAMLFAKGCAEFDRYFYGNTPYPAINQPVQPNFDNHKE